MPHEPIRFGNFRQDPPPAASESKPLYEDVDIDLDDSAMTDSRLDALRSMVLLVIREIDALKKILGPQYPERKPGESIDLVKELAEIEKAMIKAALVKTGGNQAAAAKLLSVKTTTLHEKMKRYGLKTSA
jgi:transcriptional regulator with GAF, ATPase, and Fis domain